MLLRLYNDSSELVDNNAVREARRKADEEYRDQEATAGNRMDVDVASGEASSGAAQEEAAED